MFHVLNRAAGRRVLFENDGDYEAMERVLWEAQEFQTMRVLAYCLMPNHWHLILQPWADGELSEFMRWLTITHTQRYHAFHDSVGTGPIYQGRFKSFPVQSDEHFLSVCRYVERNPVRAGLRKRAENWRWSSLWLRHNGDPLVRKQLHEWPTPFDGNWTSWVNKPLTEIELRGVTTSLLRGRPYGLPVWQRRTAARLGLKSTFRPRGRPRKR